MFVAVWILSTGLARGTGLLWGLVSIVFLIGSVATGKNPATMQDPSRSGFGEIWVTGRG